MSVSFELLKFPSSQRQRRFANRLADEPHINQLLNMDQPLSEVCNNRTKPVLAYKVKKYFQMNIFCGN